MPSLSSTRLQVLGRRLLVAGRVARVHSHESLEVLQRLCVEASRLGAADFAGATVCACTATSADSDATANAAIVANVAHKPGPSLRAPHAATIWTGMPSGSRTKNP